MAGMLLEFCHIYLCDLECGTRFAPCNLHFVSSECLVWMCNALWGHLFA